jgi:hypothetical protein
VFVVLRLERESFWSAVFGVLRLERESFRSAVFGVRPYGGLLDTIDYMAHSNVGTYHFFISYG